MWKMIKTFWKVYTAYIMVGGIVAIGLAIAIWFHFHDKKVIDEYETGVQVEVVKQAQEADQKVEIIRQKDIIILREREKAYEDAIEQADEDTPSDPAIALGCERLRRSGQDTDSIPECFASQ